ncbi:hypothetical protein GEMRC1_002497 [Eukaryota sp. GEM-RC1]
MQRECPSCFERFLSKDLLFSHIKTCKPEALSPLPKRVDLTAQNDSEEYVSSPRTKDTSSVLARSQQMHDRVKDSYVRCSYCERTFLPSRIQAHERACSPSLSRPGTPKNLKNTARPSSRTSKPRQSIDSPYASPRSTATTTTTKVAPAVESFSEPVSAPTFTSKYLLEETLGIKVFGFINKSKDRVCLGEVIIDCNTTINHVVSMIKEQLNIDSSTLLKNSEVPIHDSQGFIPAFCFFKSATDTITVLR